MNKLIALGKSVEDAITAGLGQLNTTRDRVKIQVLEHPSKGFLGLIGSKEAKVELERIPDLLEETIKFLKDVFRSMNLIVEIERVENKDELVLNLTGPDLGILIGRRGQTLDSLQYLANIVANRYSEKHLRIILDAENFRERRRTTLEQLAMRLASRVIRTKGEVILEPMSPLERKVIHSQLQDHPKVKTYSKGEDPNRRVVITLR
ncbi:MAG TPA: RNA-binding cell elongation regulator Jag/EloR [Bacilli bacterium]